MSLGFALDMTMRGLLSTSSRLGIVSQNITNAGKAGYTRKEGVDEYVTTNAGTVPVKTNIIGSTDKYMTKSVVTDVSTMGYNKAVSDILEFYSSQLGSTDGSKTMSGYLNDLYGALQQLSVSPETLANKTEAVQIAQNLTDSLRNLSGDIQELRLQAEQKITDTVTNINSTIDRIAKINDQIVPGATPGAQIADLEDQRMAALEDLAQQIDIQYYFTAQNQVRIFTSGGVPLVSTEANHLQYSTTTNVTRSSTFSPITINGIDITNTVSGGTLKGNIEIRDSILPQEQEKLDQFATVLSDQMNTILNKGASYPPRSSMTGSLRGLTAATPLSATGSFRIAVVDKGGTLNNYADIPLGGITNVGQLLAALNAVPNVSATLDINGALQIDSTLAGNGISFNEMTSSVGASSWGISHYFGLQNMFDGANAGIIVVSDYLTQNSNTLATGSLNPGTIAAGDAVITRGDASISLSMAKILTSNVSFAAAGNFSAQTNTLNRYIEAFIADGSTQAKLADDQYETTNAIYKTSKDALNNTSGVNVDEETTKMLSLQNSYQASARMISTIRDLFQELMNAVS